MACHVIGREPPEGHSHEPPMAIVIYQPRHTYAASIFEVVIAVIDCRRHAPQRLLESRLSHTLATGHAVLQPSHCFALRLLIRHYFCAITPLRYAQLLIYYMTYC